MKRENVVAAATASHVQFWSVILYSLYETLLPVLNDSCVISARGRHGLDETMTEKEEEENTVSAPTTNHRK
jgi:hypothetical protein